MNNRGIKLDGINEGEDDQVYLDKYDGRIQFFVYNEGGFNCTSIDALNLMKFLGISEEKREQFARSAEEMLKRAATGQTPRAEPSV